MSLRECLNNDALPSHLNRHVCEYASRPLFWQLSVFVGLSCVFYIVQDRRHVNFPNMPLPNPPYRRPGEAFLRKISPFFTSSPRKAVLFLIYLVGLLLQCAETYWAAATWVRLVSDYFPAWAEFLRQENRLGFQLAASFPLVVFSTLGIFYTAICVYVVVCQTGSMREIIAMCPRREATASDINLEKECRGKV